MTFMIDGVVYNLFDVTCINEVMERITKGAGMKPTIELGRKGQYAECICGLSRSTVCCKEANMPKCKWCHNESCTELHQVQCD